MSEFTLPSPLSADKRRVVDLVEPDREPFIYIKSIEPPLKNGSRAKQPPPSCEKVTNFEAKIIAASARC